MNLFMLGYQRFVILFYLYLFITKGNAPVLSGTPGSCPLADQGTLTDQGPLANQGPRPSDR